MISIAGIPYLWPFACYSQREFTVCHSPHPIPAHVPCIYEVRGHSHSSVQQSHERVLRIPDGDGSSFRKAGAEEGGEAAAANAE
jgi:hypothetical protein